MSLAPDATGTVRFAMGSGHMHAHRPPSGDHASVEELAARAFEIRRRTAEFFSEYLWDSDAGRSALRHMSRLGVESETLLRFSVGYAPGGWAELRDHLNQWDYEPAELQAAGLAVTSGRGAVHVRFRSRVMFPVIGRAGAVVGFAGLATNPGPSWPAWTISPEGAGFRRADAVLGLQVASVEIRRLGSASLLDDGVELMRAHQRGHGEAVAAVRTRIGIGQIKTLAGVIEVPLERLEVTPVAPAGAEPAALRVRSTDPEAGPAGDAGRLGLPRGHKYLEPSERRIDPRRSEPHLGGVRPDPISVRTPLANALLQISRVIVGIGIPLGWLAILGVDTGAPGGSGTAFVGAVACVAITYFVIALIVAVVSGRVRLRSGSRRMRGVWARGATEWEPPAWTYHFLEDLSIGAAILSVFVCLVLFLTIGGFID